MIVGSAAWRRLRARGGLIFVLATLIALVAASVGILFAATSLATTQRVLDELAARPPIDTTLTLSATEVEAVSQRAAAAALLDELLASEAVTVSEGTIPGEDGEADELSWTLTIDAPAFSGDDILRIASSLDAFAEAFDDDAAISDSGTDSDGVLALTLEEIAEGVRTQQGVNLVAQLLLGLIAVVVLAQAARLLGSAREGELRLLRARGVSSSRLAAAAAIESLVIALPSSIVGVAAAGLVLGAVFSRDPGWATLIGVALGVVVTGVIVFAVTAFLDAQRAGTIQSRPTRTIRVAAVAAPVLVGVLTLVSLAQFLLYGSPIVALDDGSEAVDPLIAAAPALTLLTLTLLGSLLVGPVGNLAERTVESRRVDELMAVRHLSRRPRLAAVTVVVGALAVGAAILASTYAGTAQQVAAVPSALRAGSDVVVSFPTERVPDIAAIIDTAGGDPSTPVQSTVTRLGNSIVGATVGNAESLSQTMTPLSGPLSAEQAAALHSPSNALVPVNGELGVTVTATVSNPGNIWYFDDTQADYGFGPVTATVWVMDDTGMLTSVTTDSLLFTEYGEVLTTATRFTLPAPLAGEWLLAAVDAHFAAGSLPAHYSLTTAVTDDGGEVLNADAWALAWDSGEDFEGNPLTALNGQRLEVTTEGYDADFRTMPEELAIPDPVPAILSADVASSLDAGPGTELGLTSRIFGEDLPIVVSDIIPTVPGSAQGAGLVMDLRSLSPVLLATQLEPIGINQVWIATDDPATMVDSVSAVLPESAAVRAVANPPASVAASALVAGAAGILLLAGISTVAGTRLGARLRRAEVVLLRAIGLTPRRIARSRRVELGLTLGYALILGAIAGIVVAVVTVPILVRSATPGYPDALAIPLAVDTPIAVALGFGLLLLGTAAVLLAGRGVPADLASTRTGGER